MGEGSWLIWRAPSGSHLFKADRAMMAPIIKYAPPVIDLVSPASYANSLQLRMFRGLRIKFSMEKFQLTISEKATAMKGMVAAFIENACVCRVMLWTMDQILWNATLGIKGRSGNVEAAERVQEEGDDGEKKEKLSNCKDELLTAFLPLVVKICCHSLLS